MARVTLDHVKNALALPDFDFAAAHILMAPSFRARTRDKPGEPKLAAVLILLFVVDSELRFPLMRRTEYPGAHSGQISLPGGSREPHESWSQTALRETCEEFGICDSIEVLGDLTPIYVAPSDFEIHPLVGATTERPIWKPDPREVAEIIEIRLTDLLDSGTKAHDERKFGGETVLVPYYRVGTHKVWGATAIMLSEFEQRLRAVL